MIDIVKSDDVDLQVIVEGIGDRIITPFSEDQHLSFVELNRFYPNLHPKTDGYMQALLPLDNNPQHDMGNTIWRIFTNRNNVCWSVMDSLLVVGENWKLFSGVDEIHLDAGNSSDGVELVQDGARLCVMMCLAGIHKFSKGLYKCVEY